MVDGFVDSAAHRAAVLRFLNDCLQHFSDRESVRLPAANRRALIMLWGPINQVARFVRAGAHLFNAGLEIDAQVLARSALEYAMTIQYAYLRVDGLDRLEKGSYYQRKKLFESLAEWNDDPTYLDLVPKDATKPGAKGMPKFSEIINILDPAHLYLHTTYAVLSQVTHVTPGSQTRYFAVENDELILDPGRAEDGFGNVTVGALAFAMMGATWVLAHMMHDTERLEALDRYSDRLKIPLRYDEDWPASQRAHHD
ncbi:DUF5677 domain-containing protein [Microbacterium sp. HMWF026]|uniref:DUF5677 domain-containing protein n=1 Tax=Microbacterium sp. HMWF026 TaxID=2056861 RepID=UPI0011B1D7CF|nr:DUF5677 domain-containing protein [Microbacterium sp. HMWF026]